ncbi:MAG: autotransporter-associated beta strand repeat-containing protein [Burkholderiales bacterium]|nr:autotransporter-associated beta strand repeat-containing protein [Opitutaceae bacterium]
MATADKKLTPSRPALRRAARKLLAALLALGAASDPCTLAAATFSETFTGTTAPGWVFDANPGDTDPVLTANTVDSPGTGWLRLNTNTNNQSTSALLDTQIFSVNAKIEIEMEFAFFNGTGADGITFFLVDGAQDSSTFAPGAYGGSMGYAQRTGEAGMAGGYLGFALDTFGNYSNDEEGRTGGYASGLRPNNVVVRGPESSNWAYIDDSGDLGAFDFNGAAPGGTGLDMDFYGSTTRPVQSGADYRQFKITLDANNQLSVEMRFGVGNDYVEVFTSDLSAFERPETFKIGFTGATGGSTGIHEVRNLTLTSTPWSSGSGAYEWDDTAGNDTWGTSAGTEANSNWYSSVSGDDNKTPTPGSDILFGNKPASGPQSVNLANNVVVRNMTFDTPYDYTLDGAGTITFGDAGTGLPSINVNNYNGNDALGRHKINNDLSIVENIAIRNYSYSTLCLNGDIALGANTLTTSGYGATNFNGVITGSGPLVVNGSSADPATGQGIVTISGNNASTYTGAITVNGGQLVALHNGALGDTGSGTTVNDGGTLTFRGGISTAENITLAGSGAVLGRGASLALTEQAGAIYNDGGDNTLSGTVTLSADAAIGSRAGTLTLSGTLTGGSYDLTKLGAGTVHIQSAPDNLYDAAFIIHEGALRFDASSFSTSMNYQLAGGVLEIGGDLYSGTGDLALNLGAGNNALQWTGDGGFAARGADRSIYLNYNENSLAWGSTNFVQDGAALILGSTTSTHNVTLQNDLDLGSLQREVRVIDGSGVVDGTLRDITGSGGGIVKTGAGTLALAGTNTYSGATLIQAGALRGSTGANSNIQLDGGVRELNGNYTSNLGTTGGLIQWIGDGGISADTANRTFNVGNNNQTLTWAGTTGNSQYFVGDGDELILGSRSSSALLTFDNAIDLNAGTRTIRVLNGSAAEDVRLNRALSNGNLVIAGDGRVDATASSASLAGSVTVTGAELRLTGSGTMASASGFVVRQGGTLTLDNNATLNTDRIGNTADITLSGGSLSLVGRAANNSNLNEDIGRLVLTSGDNTVNITVNNTQSNTRNRISADELTRSSGATVNFTSNTTNANSFGVNASSYRPTVTFGTAPTPEQGILAYATVTTTESIAFAGYDATNGITRVAGTNTAQGSWAASIIAASTNDQQLTGDRTVGALILGSGIDVTQDATPRTLTVQTGGILSNGTTASTISAANLQVGGTGNRELIIHVYGAGGLNISSVIRDNGNTTALTKSGDGTLTLSGSTANTFTGATTVNAGTLVLDKSDNVTAIAGNLAIGDGRGIDTVRLDSNEQIANSATVSLRGGEVGNAANVARLELAGATNDTFGSRIESFTTLSITGNTILDFGGGTPCSPTFLYLDFLDVAADALLTITNWIEFTDFLLVAKDTFTSEDLGRVIFDGYGGSASWKDYDSDYYQIVPYAPVPEPAAYGALSLGGLAAFGLLRRRRRK